ncbi:precorrin-6y C5,15-methyltransferase (decarboxylating) subunit CbiE [Lachnospiraceae bacterium 54-53]
MCRVLIFGGTTEGRLLAEYCHEKGISAWVSVATGYGKTVLPESRFLHIHEAPMDAGEMEAFMRQKGIALVFDATHPYAAVVSRNIRLACEPLGIRPVRVVREPSPGWEEACESGGRKEWAGREEERILWAGSVEEAVLFLNTRPGNVLVTTGSKELSLYKSLDSWENRVFARVLPTVPVISACDEMGIKGKHLIGIQGPFSEEMNRAMIKQYDIRYLVTKEAGNAGGFPEKIKAAAECGITAVVIGRPSEEDGISLEEGKRILSEARGLKGRTGPEPVRMPDKRKVSLIGIGMGGPDQLTVKALKELQACDAVFGAERMLHGVSGLHPGAVKLPFYLSGDILPWIKEHGEFRRIGVLFSGDTGFYSGAKKMAEGLARHPYGEMFDTEIFPGISSVSYLCSRLKTGWEDVRLLSLHGREWDIINELETVSRVFALLDGNHTVKSLCRLLKEGGYGRARLSVGERLSYPDERITVGTPDVLERQEFDVLSAVLIER